MTGRHEYIVKTGLVTGKMHVFLSQMEARRTLLKLGKLQLWMDLYYLMFSLVSTFDRNFISIGQLSGDMNCIVTFCSDLCLIQDRQHLEEDAWSG